jgi:hypothetical protein
MWGAQKVAQWVAMMAEQWDDCWADMMVTMTDAQMVETMGVWWAVAL